MNEQLSATETAFVLSPKECEAIMWTLGIVGDRPERVPDHPTDPLFALLEHHARDAVMAGCAPLWDMVMGEGFLTNPADPVERDILRVCVENSTWLFPYIDAEDTPYSRVLLTEARCALQTLAAKLDCLGIAINHIPRD